MNRLSVLDATWAEATFCCVPEHESWLGWLFATVTHPRTPIDLLQSSSSGTAVGVIRGFTRLYPSEVLPDAFFRKPRNGGTD